MRSKKKKETSNGQKNKHNENETMISMLVQILLPAKSSILKMMCFIKLSAKIKKERKVD